MYAKYNATHFTLCTFYLVYILFDVHFISFPRYIPFVYIVSSHNFKFSDCT